MEEEKRYPSDLTEAEWAILEPLVPQAKPGGHPRTVNIREVVNGIFYVLRGGIPWRFLPKDFPPWQTVYYYFWVWRREGVFERMNTVLREKDRMRVGWEPTPSAGVMDSQSAKTTEGGPRGYNRGKKVKGRKRHLLVDTQGLVIKAKVLPADLHDREGAKLLLAPLAGQLPRMAKVWADSAYQGLKKWVKEILEWDLEVVKHWWTGLRWVWVPEGQEPPALEIPAGFQVLPRRWAVERTFGWLGRNRRLSKDYEFLPETEEAFIYLGMMWLMLRRLAKAS